MMVNKKLNIEEIKAEKGIKEVFRIKNKIFIKLSKR